MRLELTRVGLLVELANHYTTRGALVGQLCTNPKSDRSLLSCLKVTQCSTSEIGDAPLYNTCSLPIQVMTARTIAGLPWMCHGCAQGDENKVSATVIVFGVVSSVGHIMPPHIFEVGLKVNTKVYLDVLKSVMMPWFNQVAGGLGVAAGLSAGPQVQRDPGLASERVRRLCTLLSLEALLSDLNPVDYFVWSYVENITNMTSHNTKASLIAAIRRVFTELPVPDQYRGGD